MNARQRSQNAVRNAYGAFLPSASTNIGTSYRQGKPQFFAGVQFGSNSDIMSSSWGLNVNASMSANTLANLRRTQANEDASDNDVRDAEQALVSGVTQQYLFVLQTAARAAVQDSLIASTQLQLELARAKAGVGSATSLDVLRAEVAVGQQQVASLRAHNLADVAMLQLFQQIGVAKPERVTLTSRFEVTEPKGSAPELLRTAEEANPRLKALRARENAANYTFRGAQGAYLPSLSFNASFGGVAQQYKDGEYLVTQQRTSLAGSQRSCFTTDSLRRGAGMSSIAAKSIGVESLAKMPTTWSSPSILPCGIATPPPTPVEPSRSRAINAIAISMTAPKRLRRRTCRRDRGTTSPTRSRGARCLRTSRTGRASSPSRAAG